MLLALGCWLAGSVYAAEPQILEEVELESIEGGDMILSVDRKSQKMTVLNASRSALLKGDKKGIWEDYQVNVTTKVVSNGDKAKFGIDRDSMVNYKRAVGDSKGTQYFPVQLPPSTYALTGYQGDVGGMGQGIKIDASVPTPLLAGGTANYSDFFIHDTYVLPSGQNCDNTYGCIGTKNKDIDKVVKTYWISGGDKTVTVNAYVDANPKKAKKK